MKKHLLLNQLFGTEGSPNQTGETLTRENRIGLMSHLRRTLMLLFAVLVMSVANIGTAWAQDTISVVETGDNRGLLEIILTIIAAVGGAGFAIHYAKNVKKNKSSNNQKTEGNGSPVTTIDTHGENSDINNQGGIMGSNNTIQNGLSADDLVKLAQASQPTNIPAVPTEYDMDRKLVQKFFSRFNVNVFKEFITMRNPAYLDNRILDMRDGWYDLYNPTEPPFIDAETKNMFDEFYQAFDSLSRKCVDVYEPSSKPKLSHFRGFVGDEFVSPKDEERFDEIVEDIKALTPIYDNLIKFVIKKYKIDLDHLSAEYEKKNPY